jgi:hypothetical protein
MGAISCHFGPLSCHFGPLSCQFWTTLDHFGPLFSGRASQRSFSRRSLGARSRKFIASFPAAADRQTPVLQRAVTTSSARPKKQLRPRPLPPGRACAGGRCLDCQRTSRPLRWPYHILRGKLKMVTGPWRRVPGRSNRLSATPRGRHHEPRPRAGNDRRLVTGNPPVRFDERDVETEHGMRLLRHRRGNPDPEYAEAYPTAPPLDSTRNSQFPARLPAILSQGRGSFFLYSAPLRRPDWRSR